MGIRANCKKMASMMRKGKYKRVGDCIDPLFKEGLKEFGIFLETVPTKYTLEKIIKNTILEGPWNIPI